MVQDQTLCVQCHWNQWGYSQTKVILSVSKGIRVWPLASPCLSFSATKWEIILLTCIPLGEVGGGDGWEDKLINAGKVLRIGNALYLCSRLWWKKLNKSEFLPQSSRIPNSNMSSRVFPPSRYSDMSHMASVLCRCRCHSIAVQSQHLLRASSCSHRGEFFPLTWTGSGTEPTSIRHEHTEVQVCINSWPTGVNPLATAHHPNHSISSSTG